MIEEGISKDSIKVTDLINSDLLISVNENQTKLSIRNSKGILSLFQEWDIKESESLWDLLSFSAADLNTCKSINILTHSEKYSIVPAEFYSEENNKDFLAQLILINNSLPVVSEYVKSANAYLIYQPFYTVVELLKNCPQQTKLQHHAGIFIQFEQERIQSDNYEVFIHFEVNSFNCIVFKEKKLIYSNNQSFITASDAIYFLLSIFQKIKLDTNEQVIIISGKIMPYSELYNTIFRFINKVGWFTSPASTLIDVKEDTAVPHLFSDLIRLSACV